MEAPRRGIVERLRLARERDPAAFAVRATLAVLLAVLIGRLRKSLSAIHVDGQSSEQLGDQQWTIMRVILPVGEP